MTIFNLYIFNRDGQCMCYKEWKREKQSGMSKPEEMKLLFGMLHSLKSFSERLSTRDGKQQIRYFKTSGYKTNFMETATGMKMVLNTDPNATGIADLLKSIYQIYVETVLKNPLCEPGSEITSEMFFTKVDDVVTKNPAYVQ